MTRCRRVCAAAAWLWSLSGLEGVAAQQAPADTLVPLSVAALREPAIRRQVRVSVDSVDLAAAIRRLATLAGVDFVWDASLPEFRRPVSLHAETITLAAAVTALLDRADATASVEVLVSPPATLVLRRARGHDARASDGQRMVGALEGTVENAATGEPVAGASVHVMSGRGAWTDAAGRFTIRDLPVGLYTLLVRRLGFAPVRIPGVGVDAGVRGSLMLRMHPAALALSDAVITTATYSAFDDLGSPPTVTREQFATMPQLAEDALRAVARLPGVAADDYGARLHIRGGTGDDVLVTIDGLELIEPFHLRDLGGTVSLVDARTVGALRLAAGDMGADYGNRLAGVVAIQSIDPADGQTRDDAAVDLLHASARARGTFADGRAAWLVAGRYGFPGRALRAIDPNNTFHPRYEDVFAKTRFVAASDTLAVHLLAAGDRIHGRGVEHPSLSSSARHAYLWATNVHPVGARGEVRHVLSVGQIRTSRRGDGLTTDSILLKNTLPVLLNENISDMRTATVSAYRQDWRMNVAPSWAARFGFEIAHHSADYDYSHSVGDARTEFGLNPSTWLLGANATQRFPLGPATIAELGARYDWQSLTGEKTLSPRVHIARALGERTTLRLAWGRYAQFERVYELQVENRDTIFQQGDRAEHRAIGIEHTLPGGPVLRAEAYDRVQSRVRPRFFDPLLLPNPMPEARVLGMVRMAPLRRRSRGIEVSAATAASRSLSWRIGYAYSSAQDFYDDRVAPSPFDQRHSVNVETSYAREGQWSVGANWQLRSGWPFTDAREHLFIRGDSLRIRTDYGPVNGARLAVYHRLDIRAERQWFGAGGRLATYVDVFNVYDRANHAASFSLDVQGVDNGPAPLRSDADLLRFLPSVGVRWQF